MNKKKKIANKKHRKTRTRLKNLNDLSLKLRKKKPKVVKEMVNDEASKDNIEKKPAVKKTAAKKPAATSLFGEIPCSIKNLTMLIALELDKCQLD